MKEESISAHTERVAKVSSCDQIIMPQNLKQSIWIGRIVVQTLPSFESNHTLGFLRGIFSAGGSILM